MVPAARSTCFHLQAEDFGNPRTGGDAGFDDQFVRFIEAGHDAGGLLEGQDPALPLMALLPEFRPAGRASFAFLPEPVALRVVVDSGHDRTHAMHGPPRIERRVQPVLDSFGLNLIQAECAPFRNDVLTKVELFLSRGSVCAIWFRRADIHPLHLRSPSRTTQRRCWPLAGRPLLPLGAFSFAESVALDLGLFLVIAPSPLLGPISWYLRSVLKEPSGWISSAR